MCDPSNVQIFIEGSIREFLEQPAEVVFGKPAHGGYFVKTQFLGAVTVDIVADVHELDDIFLLFGGLDVREFVGQGCEHPADSHHQLQQTGTDGGVAKGGRAEVFLPDPVHQGNGIRMDLRIFLGTDHNGGA